MTQRKSANSQKSLADFLRKIWADLAGESQGLTASEPLCTAQTYRARRCARRCAYHSGNELVNRPTIRSYKQFLELRHGRRSSSAKSALDAVTSQAMSRVHRSRRSARILAWIGALSQSGSMTLSTIPSVFVLQKPWIQLTNINLSLFCICT